MDIETQKRKLTDRRAELMQDLDRIGEDLEQPKDRDLEDQATQRQGDDVLGSLGAADRAGLARIDAALDRIRQGSYGTCARCGETISDERLAAVPDTPLCRDCAGAGR